MNAITATSAHIISTMPWAFRAATGHFLPLLIALLCLIRLAPKWRSEYTPAFIVSMLAAGYLQYLTSAVSVRPYGHEVIVSIVMLPATIVLLTAVAAAICRVRIPAAAVIAGTFFPMYAVDVLRASQVFGDFWHGMHAVGGAGPMDGLLLVPVMALVMSWAVGRDKSLWRRFVNKSVPTRI